MIKQNFILDDNVKQYDVNIKKEEELRLKEERQRKMKLEEVRKVPIETKFEKNSVELN